MQSTTHSFKNCTGIDKLGRSVDIPGGNHEVVMSVGNVDVVTITILGGPKIRIIEVSKASFSKLLNDGDVAPAP